MEKDAILEMQRREITEHIIYSNLAKKTKNWKNRKILEMIAHDELRHYWMLKKITGKEIKPDWFAVVWYSFIASILGLTFGLKLMENSEGKAQMVYESLKKQYPELGKMIDDEERHEEELINMLSEEQLEYASSIVLGLNDAIVELTGTLAGLTFAIGDNIIIGMTGLIMGIAASLSMGTSNYLSHKEEGKKNPIKSFVYTSVAYMLTVLLLVSPYFLLHNVYVALAMLLCITILIIAGYSFYITVAKSQPFWRKFLEMVGLSFGVAIISFVFGLIIKTYLGVSL